MEFETSSDGTRIIFNPQEQEKLQVCIDTFGKSYDSIDHLSMYRGLLSALAYRRQQQLLNREKASPLSGKDIEHLFQLRGEIAGCESSLADIAEYTGTVQSIPQPGQVVSLADYRRPGDKS